MEAFAEKAGGHEDVWYATNIEIVQYTAAYKSLLFSVDGTRVFNPSPITIWFAKDETLISVPAGESRQL